MYEICCFVEEDFDGAIPAYFEAPSISDDVLLRFRRVHSLGYCLDAAQASAASARCRAMPHGNSVPGIVIIVAIIAITFTNADAAAHRQRGRFATGRAESSKHVIAFANAAAFIQTDCSSRGHQSEPASRYVQRSKVRRTRP